ncbi:hypothetical protein SHELI_v1c02940 [Spiroplasma helicoides]|uniref:DUF3196 domain-containing protein n=1 Tax=Spiroplasma helicoides TaxID=216938 RepID=A0A1B3SJY8_9MOLU|nr:DUF3196 family protein [Spiroplasma helicoides]AOG60249.1 hypothetical protein SHELI_v1c02940 [Spiroplasma helicoides]
MNDNYYDITLKKIHQLIDEEKYEEAYIIINQELSAPYVPMDFEEKLQKLAIESSSKMQNDFVKNINWNLDKVTEIMKNNLNLETQLIAIDALRNLNVRKIIPHIKQYLANPEIKNEFKTFMFFVLMEQKIDEEFEVVKFDSKYYINPCKFDLFASQNVLKEIELKLENLIYDKDPSLYTICKNVTSSYYYNAFPDFDFETNTINDIVTCILVYSQKALGLEVNWDQISEKIEFNKRNVDKLLNRFEKIL